MNEHDQTPTGPSLPEHPVTPHHEPSAASREGGPRTRPTRRVAAAVGVGAVGLAAGGILAGTLASSASAEDATSGTSATGTYAEGAHRGGPGGGAGEKALTGTTRAEVLAAVRAKYPAATVQRLETDSDGVYEAHVLLAGKATIVQVGKDFTVTGTQTGPTGPAGGRGGHADHDGDGPGGAEGGTPPSPPA
ncbi:MAG: hypothetical protein JWR20_237 [Marmoricola sp.]|nr:hypothetical protein [Marmoricola sp.]